MPRQTSHLCSKPRCPFSLPDCFSWRRPSHLSASQPKFNAHAIPPRPAFAIDCMLLSVAGTSEFVVKDLGRIHVITFHVWLALPQNQCFVHPLRSADMFVFAFPLFWHDVFSNLFSFMPRPHIYYCDVDSDLPMSAFGRRRLLMRGFGCAVDMTVDRAFVAQTTFTSMLLISLTSSFCEHF